MVMFELILLIRASISASEGRTEHPLRYVVPTNIRFLPDTVSLVVGDCMHAYKPSLDQTTAMFDSSNIDKVENSYPRTNPGVKPPTALQMKAKLTFIFSR
mgnify:FL=1